MKRILFAVLLLFWGISFGQFALADCTNQCTKGSVPCGELHKYLPQSQLDTSIREWGPSQGYFRVVGEKTVKVVLRFDQKAIDTFRSRTDFALEIDMVDPSEILGKATSNWRYSHTFYGMTVIKDTPFMDDVTQLPVLVLHPEKISKDTDYEMYFHTEQPITRSGDLKLNVSLSVDFLSGGLCTNGFYLNGVAWRYFTLEIDQFREFRYVPSASNLGVCWVNHDDSGPTYCKEYTPPVTMCSWRSSSQRVCWETKDGFDRSCESGTRWFLDDIFSKPSKQTDSGACSSSCNGNTSASLSSCAKRETGEDYVFGNSSPGAGTSKPPTDSPKSGKPNFVGRSIRLFDTSDRERYTFKKTESIVARCEIANNGTKNIPDDDEVTTMFLLSKGYNEDPHGEWKNVGTEETKSSSIEVGERQTEDDFVHLKDYPDVLPGSVHNIVFCTLKARSFSVFWFFLLFMFFSFAHNEKKLKESHYRLLLILSVKVRRQKSQPHDLTE